MSLLWPVDEVHVRRRHAAQPTDRQLGRFNVEDMYGMFEDAFAFSQAIGGWDTSGVTTLEDMFLGRDPSISRSMIGTFPVSRTCLGCSKTPRRSTNR